MRIRKFLQKIEAEQILVGTITAVGIFLVYTGHYNIFFNVPFVPTELWFVEIFLGFCFLLIAFVIRMFNRKFKEIKK